MTPRELDYQVSLIASKLLHEGMKGNSLKTVSLRFKPKPRASPAKCHSVPPIATATYHITDNNTHGKSRCGVMELTEVPISIQVLHKQTKLNLNRVM